MIRIGFYKSWSRNGLEIYAAKETPTGRIPFRITVQSLPEISSSERMDESIFLNSIKAEELVRALVDGLQEAQLMPKYSATDAELKATLRHLSDMRSLVFESLAPTPNKEVYK